MKLCGPDVECPEPGKAGQVEGGGQQGDEEEQKARQKTTHSAIFLLKAFVQPVRYFGDLDKGIIMHFICSVYDVCVCVIGVHAYYWL